jgi:hypothetical protein
MRHIGITGGRTNRQTDWNSAKWLSAVAKLPILLALGKKGRCRPVREHGVPPAVMDTVSIDRPGPVAADGALIQTDDNFPLHFL